jgi:hypothetical protein
MPYSSIQRRYHGLQNVNFAGLLPVLDVMRFRMPQEHDDKVRRRWDRDRRIHFVEVLPRFESAIGSIGMPAAEVGNESDRRLNPGFI